MHWFSSVLLVFIFEFFFWVFLVYIFLVLSLVLSYYYLVLDRELMSSYECGFSPLVVYRMPYSSQFFKLAVVFLLFDVELMLVFPVIYSVGSFSEVGVLLGLIFFIILVVGFLYEWGRGVLEWM